MCSCIFSCLPTMFYLFPLISTGKENITAKEAVSRWTGKFDLLNVIRSGINHLADSSPSYSNACTCWLVNRSSSRALGRLVPLGWMRLWRVAFYLCLMQSHSLHQPPASEFWLHLQNSFFFLFFCLSVDSVCGILSLCLAAVSCYNSIMLLPFFSHPLL